MPDALFAFPQDLGRQTKLVVLDIDGVMTDGGLYYDQHQQVMKRFDVQDGLGIKIALAAGIGFAVITGLVSLAVEKRVRDLGIEDYFAGSNDKRQSLETIRQRHGLAWEEMAYLGDDWVDLAVMHMVGLPMAVANAQPEVKDSAKFITVARGGQGAVREVVRHLLRAQGKYDAILASWSHPS